MISLTARSGGIQGRLSNHRKVLLESRKLKSSKTEYDSLQYIQHSKLPTMHFQECLPRLRIPKLHNTCNRYLDAQKPVLSTEEFERTYTYVSEFQQKEGPALQEELLARDAANPHTSYISEPWFDMYLRDRKPLPINYNPLIVYDQDSDIRYNDQLVKATNVAISSLRFMRSLRENSLKPELYQIRSKLFGHYELAMKMVPVRFRWYLSCFCKAVPMDMSQYHHLFNTTRIPRLEKDEIFQNTSARHILVMRKGHFYSVKVLNSTSHFLSGKAIAEALAYILQNTCEASNCPIGVLTTSERNNWARVRSHLLEIGNQKVLQEIDSAILCLSLDDEDLGEDYTRLVRNYLHSDGTNRWFDKSISVIVSKDGYTGVNFEHSWGDGVAVLRFSVDITNDMLKHQGFHPEDLNSIQASAENVEKLEFVVNDKVRSIVDEERKTYKKWTEELGVNYLIYNDFGRKKCKRLGVSPDAMMQLAFQLTLYRQIGHVVSTYESCSTAAFKHGRTETIRPCTMEMKEICVAMSKGSRNDDAELQTLIRKYSDTHTILAKQAMMGEGFDRHLFVLRKISEEAKSKIPDIFADPAYGALNTNVLSTSTLSNPVIIAGGFGPVVQNGYGIGYMIQDERLGAVVTSYNSERNSNDYVKGLEVAFQDIQKVLEVS